MLIIWGNIHLSFCTLLCRDAEIHLKQLILSVLYNKTTSPDSPLNDS